MEKTNTLHDENLCVTEYLSAQIAICGLSQIQIADQMGLARANVITMIKQGKTRLPIPRVPGLAKALGVDAAGLMCRVLREYQPEILETLEDTLGLVISANEAKLIRQIRHMGDCERPTTATEMTHEALELVIRARS